MIDPSGPSPDIAVLREEIAAVAPLADLVVCCAYYGEMRALVTEVTRVLTRKESAVFDALLEAHQGTPRG